MSEKTILIGFLVGWVLFWLGYSLYWWHRARLEKEEIQREFRRAHVIFREQRQIREALKKKSGFSPRRKF